MHLYLTDNAVKIGLSSKRLTVREASTGKQLHSYPFEEVEGISIFGSPQLSTSLLRACIERSIPVLFYASDGHYFGHISSQEYVDASKHRKQIYLSDNQQFCLEWSKRIITAKLLNSLRLLASYSNIYDFTTKDLQGLNHSLRSLQYATTSAQVMGFEGNGAKCYFECLNKCLQLEGFHFKGRSSRPPKDAINSMLSFGYSILYRNIIGALNAAGFHPYFGFLHAQKHGHASLASDLIEEWRAFIVDRTVIDLANSGEITPDNFYVNEAGAVYMETKTMKLLTQHLGDAIVRTELYFAENGDRKRYGFQVALNKKLQMLASALEANDSSLYQPFIWQGDE